MADALKQYGLSAYVCPTWIPERYNLAVVEVQKANEEISFSALYYDSEGNPMSFSIDYGLSPQTIHYIEKDPGSEEIYIDHGVEYLLMTNMGDWTAHWMDETSSYLLTGNITKDELKRMLNSIYER